MRTLFVYTARLKSRGFVYLLRDLPDVRASSGKLCTPHKSIRSSRHQGTTAGTSPFLTTSEAKDIDNVKAMRTRTKRGSGYTQAEVLSLLELVKQYNPIASVEWENVVKQHKINFPAEDRKLDSIKRKFQELYQTKVPTGDPFVPIEVMMAKEIQKAREEKIEASDCEGTEDLEVEESVQPGKRKDNNDDNAKDKDDDDDNNSTSGSVADASVASVKIPAKVPLMLSTRKRQKKSDSMDSFRELWQMQMLQRLQEKKDEEERRNREREEERRRWEEERRRWEEERRERRQNESLMNRMILCPRPAER